MVEMLYSIALMALLPAVVLYSVYGGKRKKKEPVKPERKPLHHLNRALFSLAREAEELGLKPPEFLWELDSWLEENPMPDKEVFAMVEPLRGQLITQGKKLAVQRGAVLAELVEQKKEELSWTSR